MDTKPGAREVAEFATSDANPAPRRACAIWVPLRPAASEGEGTGRACLPCFWLQLWFYGHIDSEGL